MHWLIPLPAKLNIQAEGNFFCTSCKKSTKYLLVERVERRLVMFLMPIDGDTLEIYVECQNCRYHHHADIIRGLSSPSIEAINAIRERLIAGSSSEDVQAALEKAGIPAGMLRTYMRTALGISHKRCKQCGSTYHGSAVRCQKCGVSLPTSAAGS